MLSLLAVLVCVGCGYSERLNGGQVEQLMTGASVQGHHTKDGYSFTRRFSADGTFVQVRSGRDEEEPGTWRMDGSRICVIRADDPKEYCRTVHHDGRGNYWKQLKKRNGDTVRIVKYSAIVDAETGADRLARLSPGAYAEAWMFSGPGLILLAATPVLLVVFVVFALKNPLKPHSLRNRIRRLFPLRVGDTALSYKGLRKLSPAALEAWIRQAAEAEEWVFVCWGWEALQDVAPDRAWSHLWAALAGLDDTALAGGFAVIVQVAPLSPVLVGQLSSEPRALWILSQGWNAQALGHQRSNATAFEHARVQALAYLEPLKALHASEVGAAPPEEEVAPGPRDYTALAGAAAEALLYLKYIQPVRSSSGYSGGG